MLEDIRHRLLEIYENCRGLTPDLILDSREDIFLPYTEALNRLAAMDVDDRHVDALIADGSLKPAIETISRLKQIHGLRLERERAKTVIAAADPWGILKGYIYYPNYLGLAEMESRGADLKAGDRVVFLGSGPLPLSLITMVKQYGILGVGIEKDPLNADLSLKVLASLGFGREIVILLGDHFLLPLSRPCSVLMVGADAVPKQEILTHLAATLPTGAKLSYRVYEKGFRRLFDRDHVGGLPGPLREYRRIRPQPPVNNTSVFVVKEDGHGW